LGFWQGAESGSRRKARAKDNMHMVSGAGRNPLAELNVKCINLGCLKLLPWPLAQRRHDVAT